MVESLLSCLTGEIPAAGLEDEAEVVWSLEVVKYGLRLRPCDSTVTACAELYCSWLSVLLPSTSRRPSIPVAIRREPEELGRLMDLFLRHCPFIEFYLYTQYGL